MSLCDRIERWWYIYEGKPRSEVRNHPWPQASNVVVPVARTWGGTIVARHFSRLTSLTDFWVARTENEAWRDPIEQWVRYLNWGARGNLFDLFFPLWDWLAEMVPMGSSFLTVSWAERTQFRYTPRSGPPASPLGW